MAQSLLQATDLTMSSSSESDSDSGEEETPNVQQQQQLMSETKEFLKCCVKECTKINKIIKSTSKLDDAKYRGLQQEVNKILNSLDSIEVSNVASLRPKIREVIKTAKSAETLLEQVYSKSKAMIVGACVAEKSTVQAEGEEKLAREVTLNDLLAQDSELRFLASNFSHFENSSDFNMQEGATCQELGMNAGGLTAMSGGNAPLTEPIQLLVEANGKLVLNEDPLRQVLFREDTRQRKIVPVSVVGGMRRGKSFLLNFLHRYLAAQERGSADWLTSEDIRSLSGFDWQAESKVHKSPNILMWPEPFFINDDLAVILLDTHGTEGTNLVDKLIFGLSTMLSSVQIYNMPERIQMDDFARVKVLLEYGKLLMDTCDEKAFHSLVLLVRDWQFTNNKPLGVGGGQALLKEWMKNCSAEESSSQQEVTDLVMLTFDTVWCYLLPYPGDNVAKKSTFKGALSDMQSEFLELLMSFVEKTLDKRKLMPKRNGRNEMVAQDFLHFARVCVELLQKSDLTAQSILEASAGVEQSKLVQASVEMYDNEMVTKMPVFENIEELHKESEAAAVGMFDFARKFGGASVTHQYRAALLRSIQEIYQTKVQKFMKQRETERQEMVDNKFRAAKRNYKKKMMMFLAGGDLETPLVKYHNELRAEGIKFFIHETKGKISDVQLVEYIEKLDKRMKETYESNIDDYEVKRAAAVAKQCDNECKTTAESALKHYRSTMQRECGGDKICSNIEGVHQRARKLALENFEQLRTKWEAETVNLHAKNLIHAIDKEYQELHNANERKMEQRRQQETDQLEGLKERAESMFTDILTSEGGMKIANKEKLKQVHDKAMEAIQRYLFGPVSVEVGVVKSKPYIKSAKQGLKRVYQDYKLICATNNCYNVLVDTFKSDIQRLRDIKISTPALKKQYSKLKSDVCNMFKDRCGGYSNFQAKSQELAKELDDIFEIFLHEKENSLAALQKKQEDEACKEVDQWFQSNVAKLEVGKTFIPDLKSKLDGILHEACLVLKKHWRGSDTSCSAKWNEIYKMLASKCFALTEINNRLEPPVDEYAIAYEKGVTTYNSEMNEFIEKNLPESSDLGKYHQTALRSALKVFNSSPKKLILTVEMKTEFLNDLENLFDKFKITCSLKLREKRMQEEKNGDGKSYAIGIDLGTTYSCATVYKNGKVVPILNKEKQHTTPSVVYIDDLEIVVGEAAQHKGFIDPDNCISEVKRFIGRPYTDPVVQDLKKILGYTIINEKNSPMIETTKSQKTKWQAEEISAEVLKEMKRHAEVQLNCPVHDAVVTIPAYFTEPQRSATMHACKLAGLNVLRLLNEPTAAAITYGVENMSDEKRHVLVFDFGGGTCDISVLEVKAGEFTVKASNGDNKLGGEDFDDRLVEFVIGKIEAQHGHRFDRTSRRRLRFKCEIAKRRLSDCREYTISLVECFDEEDLDFSIKRKDFEDVCGDLFERALKPVEVALQEAGLDKGDIDEIVLAGGSSRIPKVRSMLSTFFNGKTLNCSINPDEAISSGAAIEAARLTGECQTCIKVLDITPFSLGVSLVDDTISVVIAKKSQIPCQNTETYVTASHFQKAFQFCVYQGENFANKNKNTLLGKFTLNNIRRARAGMTRANVTFKIDANGILKVTAVEVGSGDNENVSSMTITKNVCI